MSPQPQPPLLTAHQRVVSGDINELHDAVEPLAVGHDLRSVDPHTPLDGVVNGLTLGEVSLVWVRYGGRGAIVDTPPTGGAFALCAPQAPMSVRYLSNQGTETAGGNLVLSQDEPMRMRPHPEDGCLVIATTIGRLREHLRDLLGYMPPQPLRFDGVGVPPVTAAPIVERTWRHVCALLDEMAYDGVHDMVARSLEQSLLSAILLGLPHTATAALATEDVPRADRGLAGAIREWLEAHHRLPIGVTDLATAMDVTVRHVHAVCRQEFGIPPMRLLRAIRLDHVRAALITADPSEEIAAIAGESGFTHMGRFAGAYRERFGETPSETRRRVGLTP